MKRSGRFTRQEYGLSFREYLGVWFDVHEMLEQNGDLLTKAAERLYQDKILGCEFWEEEILLTP